MEILEWESRLPHLGVGPPKSHGQHVRLRRYSVHVVCYCPPPAPPLSLDIAPLLSRYTPTPTSFSYGGGPNWAFNGFTTTPPSIIPTRMFHTHILIYS